MPLTRVLPIVGLDVGTIGCISLFSFSSGLTFAIRLFVVIFNKSFSIEPRLPGGGFSTAPPSAILVRCASLYLDTLIMEKKKFDSGIVLSFALLILGIASIFFPYFLFNGVSLFGYALKVDKYNELGEFIGGITAPFLSISAFILLYITYKSQKQELLETRQILKEQNTTLQKQQFETTFFNLLTLHHQIINAIDFDSSLDIEFYEEETDGEKRQLKGRDCFREFFYIYIKKYRNWEADEKKTASQRVEYKIELEKYLISAAFGDFYTEHEVDFGHYYRNLQSIIEFIDNSIVLDKGFYINILRSQLSTYEIILIFYSCLWLDDSEMKTLVEKYSLLKAINHQHLNRMEDIQLIDKKAYS